MKAKILIIIIIVIIFIISFFVFSNRNNQNNNKFSSTTINLETGDSRNKKTESLTISSLKDNKIEGQKKWNLKNIGDSPGKFVINLENIKSDQKENKLGDIVSAKFYINDVFKVSVPLNQHGSEALINYWNDEVNIFVLQPDQEIELKIEWFESSIYKDEAQESSLFFDLNFHLQSVIN